MSFPSKSKTAFGHALVTNRSVSLIAEDYPASTTACTNASPLRNIIETLAHRLRCFPAPPEQAFRKHCATIPQCYTDPFTSDSPLACYP